MSANLPPGQNPPGMDPRFPYGKGGPQSQSSRYPSQPHSQSAVVSGMTTRRVPSTGPAVITETRRKFPWWAWLITLAALVFAAFSFFPGLMSPSEWFGGGDSSSPSDPGSWSAPAPTTDPDPAVDPAVDPTSVPEPTEASAPTPQGDGYVVGNWEVEYIEVNLEATDLLDSFGKDMVESGKIVVGVKLRLTNLGNSAAAPADRLSMEMRFPGQYYGSYGSYYVDSDDQFYLQGEVKPGAKIETWSYFDAPEDFTTAELWIFDYEDYASDPLLITIP